MKTEELKKWTIRVDNDQFQRITNKLYYGQPTKLIRMFLSSLQELIEKKKTNEIIRYMQGFDSLLLPRISGTLGNIKQKGE